MTSTHTFTTLEVSASTYQEIKKLLFDAGYAHAFVREGEQTCIDMHGIALVQKKSDHTLSDRIKAASN